VATRDVKLTVGTITRVLLWLVYAWVVIDLVLLFLAFILRLFGANPDAGFTEWVYRSVQRAMAPFRGIFEPIALTDESVLDTSLLFAMIIYGLVALFLKAGIDWLTAFLARHRRQLEQEQWAAAQAAAVARAGAPVAGTPAVASPAAPSGFPNVVVPASPAGRSPGQPPPPPPSA
jgi:uncharacterized protein YggT (Ycf19 family)